MGTQTDQSRTPIRFTFNSKKAAQAAAYLLKLHGSRMNHMKLIKLLYLADRAMLVRQGHTITGDAMVSMKCGPVLSNVCDLIKRNPFTTIAPAWSEHITEPMPTYEVELNSESPIDELSEFEVGLLDKTYEEYGQMNEWQLVNHTHKHLPEWKDPGKSVLPIQPEDILRAENIPDSEIEQIRTDAAELLFFDSLAR